MVCLSSEMKQRGGLVWFNLSQVSGSPDSSAAHLLLLPSTLGQREDRSVGLCLLLPCFGSFDYLM